MEQAGEESSPARSRRRERLVPVACPEGTALARDLLPPQLPETRGAGSGPSCPRSPPAGALVHGDRILQGGLCLCVVCAF